MQRMSIPEAADALGLTRDAIRKRVKRESIQWEVDPSGETFVYVDASGHNGDMSADTSGLTLAESLQNQVEYLRDELSAEREANRENRRLLAAALERIPAIESPEATESPSEAVKPQSNTNNTPAPENEPHPRSWWRRFFGFE